MITKNYQAREAGLEPDRMYLADKLYFQAYVKYFGADYSFYDYEMNKLGG